MVASLCFGKGDNRRAGVTNGNSPMMKLSGSIGKRKHKVHNIMALTHDAPPKAIPLHVETGHSQRNISIQVYDEEVHESNIKPAQSGWHLQSRSTGAQTPNSGRHMFRPS